MPARLAKPGKPRHTVYCEVCFEFGDVSMTVTTPAAASKTLIARVLTGFAGGLAIGLLINQGDEASLLWTIATTAILFTGVVLLAGLGSIRPVVLAIWAAVVAVGTGLIAWHGSYAEDGNSFEPFLLAVSTLLAYPMVFIANELVTGGDQAGKPVATYDVYYDEAWKRGVQLGLALLFTGLFWAILAIGVLLLAAIGFDWFGDLLANEYVALPLTGMAFAVAVHLGDVRSDLLATARNILLGVLAWLLPVITIVAALFVVSLPFAGLDALWETGNATGGLLWGSVFFVLLINAAVQNADPDRKPGLVLGWSARIASALLLVFAGLAAWGILLRVGQHGLSPARVIALLGVLIALLYAFGYVFAAFKPGSWMAMLKPVNIGMAFISVLAFIAVLSPVAAPGRLAADNQLSRLAAGTVDIKTMDWRLLAQETGGYGKAALERLANGTDREIADLAKKALAGTIAFGDPQTPVVDLTAKSILDAALFTTVLPSGAKLPDGLAVTPRQGKAEVFSSFPCQPDGRRVTCKALLIDLQGDARPEVVVGEYDTNGNRNGPISVLAELEGGWTVAAQTYNEIDKLFSAETIAVPAPWKQLKSGDAIVALDLLAQPQPEPAPADAGEEK